VAESVAQLRKVHAVYASPLERAEETATPIAERLGLPVQLENGLLECDFGDWTGAQLRELAKLPEWRTVQRWPSGWRFPGGESFVELQLRMVGITEELRRRHPGETVVAVSHADPIKAVASSALGTPLDLFQRVLVSPCSVTAISYGEGGPAVVCLNARAAGLPELLAPPSPPRRRSLRRAKKASVPGNAPASPPGDGLVGAAVSPEALGNGQRAPAAGARRRGRTP
jgi:probable phosphoglycerate mutase